jgi:hypothetical protein
MADYGLGAIPSPLDERDFPIEAAYAATGTTPPLALAAVYTAPRLPPVYNQSTTPRCVAYSSATMKGWQDLIDQKSNYNWDFGHFFRDIGGGPNGAYLRTAMDRLLKAGYPVRGWFPSEAKHRIRGYYAVSKNVTAIKSAIATFGPVVMAVPWYDSWMRTTSNGLLPAPDHAIGGHAITIIGWDDSRGAFRLRNSWGTAWGLGGDCYMKYTTLVSKAWEVWKTLDVIDK